MSENCPFLCDLQTSKFTSAASWQGYHTLRSTYMLLCQTWVQSLLCKYITLNVSKVSDNEFAESDFIVRSYSDYYWLHDGSHFRGISVVVRGRVRCFQPPLEVRDTITPVLPIRKHCCLWGNTTLEICPLLLTSRHVHRTNVRRPEFKTGFSMLTWSESV